jgi:hypothetical protein
MGTEITCTFRLGGSNKAKIEAALGFISKIQQEYAEFSGNGVCDFSHVPEDVEGDLKHWFFYCKLSEDGPPHDLLEQLAPLTKDGDFHFWFYQACDEYCESRIEHYEDGECSYEAVWDNESLGSDGAFALVKLENECDVKAALELAYVLQINCLDGWHDGEDQDSDDADEGEQEFAGWEDDSLYLANAKLAASELSDAFRRWPTLLGEIVIQEQITNLNRNLDQVLVGLENFGPTSYAPEIDDKLKALKAILENKELKRCTPPAANAASVRTPSL